LPYDDAFNERICKFSHSICLMRSAAKKSAPSASQSTMTSEIFYCRSVFDISSPSSLTRFFICSDVIKIDFFCVISKNLSLITQMVNVIF
jgi:hypothetical protein